MAKKNFTQGFNDILSTRNEKILSQNQGINEKVDKKEVSRTTLLMDADLFIELKAIAWYERIELKEAVNRAIKLLKKKYPAAELNQIVDDYTSSPAFKKQKK